MKENGMKTSSGIILVMLGLVLYNLFKDSKIIIALFIILIVISLYEICKLYKRSKSLTYDSMMYIVAILMLIIGIFYKGNYGNVSGSWFIPLSISVLIIAFIIILLIKGRKVVDRKSMNLAIVCSIISIILLILMMVLGIMWS
ncbi:hypothetical protein GCM10008908_28980 [Clostridium subterminale]|uniref:DUF5668 domain-containing protein n=1 Tax=Clostridium subterminale TaxID=1550 RepID=A0ABN1KUA0_CLOSU